MRAKGGKKRIKRRKSRNLSRPEKRTISTSRDSEPQKDKKKPSWKPITARRLWLFRIVALTVIPALLFLLLELGLRIVGYGFAPSATIRCKVNGMEAYGDNIKFGWRFFPPTIAREFDPFVFPADKPDNTYRVFILGASAAKGEPDSAFCFGRFLEVMLRQRYPGTNFEVITAATAAINSHVVVEIAGDCAHHQPDLFIVYLGNNEVIGPYGAGTVFSPISGSQSLEPPPHEPGVLPRWLHEQGVGTVIAGGMGMRAQQIFAQYDIAVVTGAPAGEPTEVVQQWLAGQLATGDNVCDH